MGTTQSIDAETDIAASSVVDIDNCDTVCLVLGPYRNLTTLTAATLFLHPHCQVLNHGGVRILHHPKLDFLRDFSRERLDNFIRYAIWISAEGERGDFGGSIVLSHAFQSSHPLRSVFERAGGSSIKPQIKCLVWKESQRITNILRENQSDIVRMLESDERLRFLLPIRNPLDCAVSNLRTGHVEHFPHLNRQSSSMEVVQAILDQIRWFAMLRAEYPGRFFSFFEHEVSREMLRRMADFLRLQPSTVWLTDAMESMRLAAGYDHDAALVLSYHESVRERFSDFPEFAAGLCKFFDRSTTAGDE